MNNKYLFVCYANINRSITGERVFREMLVERGFSVGRFTDSKGFDFYVGSAGINPEEESMSFGKMMSDEVSTVFAADDRIVRFLKRDYSFDDESKLVDLQVPDIYDIRFNKQRKELEKIMVSKLVRYLP